MKVKICGMREPENIRNISGLKPHYMGFIFYEGSPRYVKNEQLLTALKNVPKSIYSVGVFVNESMEDVINLSTEHDLDYVQLHGSESAKYCRDVHKHRISIIKAFSVDASFDFSMLAEYESFVDYFLFDTKTKLYGGSGKKFDWKLLLKYDLNTPYFLSGGISPADIQVISKINLPGLVGIDANSKLEIAPGLKDIGKSQQLMNEVKEYFI